MTTARTLEEQRAEFSRSPLLAMPIAGTIVWTIVGIAGAILPLEQAVWVLFIATGSTFGLGVVIGKLTGEDMLGKSRPANTFDSLFLATVAMAWLVFAIAIPFFLIEPTSLPLSVGILAGTMWLPLSWIIHHWIGYFHAIARTVLIVAVWYLFPEHRFTAVAAVIVVIYLISIAVLAKRPRPA
jgi:hypothetical protein